MLSTIFSWSTLWWLMLFIYVPSCIGLIIIVLLQKGKGVGFAGAFGAGGGSEAVFGPRSSKSLPQRITYSIAGLFMLLALLMSMLSGNIGSSVAPSLVDESEMGPASTSAPAGSLGSLFNDEVVEEAPVADVTVETPMPESTPAAEAPAADTPAAPSEAPAEAPVADGAATPAPTTTDAPVAETPAADTPAADTPAVPSEAPAEAPVADGAATPAPTTTEAPAAETPAAQ